MPRWSRAVVVFALLLVPQFSHTARAQPAPPQSHAAGAQPSSGTILLTVLQSRVALVRLGPVQGHVVPRRNRPCLA